MNICVRLRVSFLQIDRQIDREVEVLIFSFSEILFKVLPACFFRWSRILILLDTLHVSVIVFVMLQCNMSCCTDIIFSRFVICSAHSFFKPTITARFACIRSNIRYSFVLSRGNVQDEGTVHCNKIGNSQNGRICSIFFGYCPCARFER